MGGICLPILLIACSSEQDYKEPSLPEQVTFNEHIAPIVHQNCMPCHRPNSAGPFNLISYQDVSKRAKMVAHVTGIRYMPPWPADPEYRHFANEKVLSERQIQLIRKWYETGAPEGDPADKPTPPQYPDSSYLGEPDLVISMREAIPIKGNNRDNFLCQAAVCNSPKTPSSEPSNSSRESQGCPPHEWAPDQLSAGPQDR